MGAQHSPQFVAVRDFVLALDEPDRRALARLFGAMHDPQEDPTAALLSALREIAKLDNDDVVRLARWFRRYVNRWGQVPVAGSRGVKPGATVSDQS